MRTFLGAEGTRAFLETANRRDCIFLVNTLLNGWKTQHTAAFWGFSLKNRAASKCHTSYTQAIWHNQNSPTFCMQTIHNSMLNRTCRTGPLAGFHDLHSTASSQSKVSQSTVMSCLTDHSLFSHFKPLQLQWRGPSNRTSRTKYRDVFRFLQSSW